MQPAAEAVAGVGHNRQSLTISDRLSDEHQKLIEKVVELALRADKGPREILAIVEDYSPVKRVPVANPYNIVDAAPAPDAKETHMAQYDFQSTLHRNPGEMCEAIAIAYLYAADLNNRTDMLEFLRRSSDEELADETIEGFDLTDDWLAEREASRDLLIDSYASIRAHFDEDVMFTVERELSQR